jgi:hypothetical protein
LWESRFPNDCSPELPGFTAARKRPSDSTANT